MFTTFSSLQGCCSEAITQKIVKIQNAQKPLWFKGFPASF